MRMTRYPAEAGSTPADLGLVDRPLEVLGRDDRGKVEERAGRVRDREPTLAR
jgi:hypothetical protein